MAFIASSRAALMVKDAVDTKLGTKADHKSKISTFPPELIIRIVSYMCTMDRIRCSQVCRQWRDIHFSHPIGEYSVECDLASVTSGLTSNYSTEERLRRLRDYRDSWKTLQWKQSITLELSPEALLRLHGSILATCDIDAATACFEFYQLPSTIRNVARRDWTVEIQEFRVADFDIDASQNLLVAIERLGVQQEVVIDHDRMQQDEDAASDAGVQQEDVDNNDGVQQEPPVNRGGLRLHFLTLDTGAQHPDASVETIDILVRPPCTDHWELHLTDICGEYIGVLVIDETGEDFGECEFWLLNWQRGFLVMNLCSAPRNIAESFTFLSPTSLLVPMVVPAEDTLHGTLGFLVVFDCRTGVDKRLPFSEAMKHYGVVIFQLPEPASQNFYRRILMGASSCASHPSYPTPYSHLDNDVLFFADMRTRLIVLDIIIQDPESDDVRGHTLLVPSSALERKHKLALECHKRTLYHSRSWMKDTHLTTEALLQSHTSVFQRRCVAPDYTSDVAEARVVVLYEMSSAPALRRDARRSPETASQYVLRPSVDADKETWTEPVTTKLPYRKFVSNIDAGRTSDLHLGEDCLIIRCHDTHTCQVLLF